MANRIQARVDTAANWTSANPILLVGEWAVESDTMLAKLGDGVSDWNTLGYYDAGAGAVLSVNGQTGVVVISKSDVGLGNVDNTSDANKPVSTAQAAADTAVQSFSIQRGNHTGTQLASTISDFSTAADARITAQKGVANGLATLDAGSKIPVSQLPASVIGGVSYQGTWDASANSPSLASSVGTKGYYYRVNVAGSTNLDGITDWKIGDWAIYNGTTWEKVDNTDQVTSVNGYQGVVVISKSDVGLGNVDNTSDVNKPVSTAQAAANAVVQAFSIQRANHTGTQLAATISDFSATVLATVLTGLSLVTSTAVTAADTILIAIGKLQAQISLKLTDPMTTIGDLIYRNGSNVSARLAIGSDLQRLGVSSGLPAWVDQNFLVLFGSKNLGSATISGVTTLTQNTFYDTLTLAAGGVINLGGYSLYARKIDISNADALSIRRNGNNGTSAASGTGGAGGAALTSAVHGLGDAGTNGGTGTTTVGGQATAPGTTTPSNGGAGGQGSAGGASGVPNAGGALRAGGAVTNSVSFEYVSNIFLRGVSLILGGAGAGGGGAGGGDGTITGAGGGGGGGGGGVAAIYCLELVTGASTPAGVFTVRGGNGGNGFQRVTGTNMGGAGGGGGGGGGYIHFVYMKKTGSTVTNLFTANGGSGGNASNGTGTGTGGNGGSGGDGGQIEIINVLTGVSSLTIGTTGSAGTTASGSTGGSGGSGGVCQASL